MYCKKGLHFKRNLQFYVSYCTESAMQVTCEIGFTTLALACNSQIQGVKDKVGMFGTKKLLCCLVVSMSGFFILTL